MFELSHHFNDCASLACRQELDISSTKWWWPWSGMWSELACFLDIYHSWYFSLTTFLVIMVIDNIHEEMWTYILDGQTSWTSNVLFWREADQLYIFTGLFKTHAHCMTEWDVRYKRIWNLNFENCNFYVEKKPETKKC